MPVTRLTTGRAGAYPRVPPVSAVVTRLVRTTVAVASRGGAGAAGAAWPPRTATAVTAPASAAAASDAASAPRLMARSRRPRRRPAGGACRPCRPPGTAASTGRSRSGHSHLTLRRRVIHVDAVAAHALRVPGQRGQVRRRPGRRPGLLGRDDVPDEVRA